MQGRQHLFIGRGSELEALASAYRSKDGHLVLLHGRRRIGKTYLLQHFSEGRRTVFYQATRQAEAVELAQFTTVVAKQFGGFPPGYGFPTWETALQYVVEKAGDRRLAVILDEFPYLCESTAGLPSVIQRWWDHYGRTSRVMLVLCGSAQSFMTELEGSAAPLHQRFTKRIALGPLPYREAGEFVSELAPADRAVVYGVLGGTPLYLREWKQHQSRRQNLLRLFGDPSGLLVDSARLVLHTDLGDSSASYRALSAVAGGATKRNEILQKARITNERVLTRLEELKLVSRKVPVTEGADSRRGVYAVTDPYFRFWFRYIQPNFASIDRGFGEQFVDQVLLPGLNDHMGPVFEDMARMFAAGLVANRELTALDIGSWWSTDGQHEIDIVGMGRREPTFVGTVKWRETSLDWGTYTNLADHARVLGATTEIPWLMIGRGKTDVRVLERAPHVRSYSIDDLYAS